MNTLVIYYSRTGVTRKVAQAIGEALRNVGADSVEIEEITEPKSRKGALGWLMAGKDATLKRPATIHPIKADLASFDVVVIGTPVWAFSCATPVRTFCDQHGREAKQVAFFCTMGGSGDKGAFREMQALCAKRPLATLALIDRQVKQDDSEDFLHKVKAFAETIAAYDPVHATT